MSLSSSLIISILLLFAVFLLAFAEDDDASNNSKDGHRIEVQAHFGLLYRAHVQQMSQNLNEVPKKEKHKSEKKGPKVNKNNMDLKLKVIPIPHLPGPDHLDSISNLAGAANPEPIPNQPVPPQPGVVAETNYPGAWELVSLDSGVSAMHMQLMPNNKLIIFDATSLGKSNIQLPPKNCRPIFPPDKPPGLDCFAHSVEYDIQTNKVRVLKVITDPWCSSGALAPDGTLVGTGGWADGEKTIRYMNLCDNCDWRETSLTLADMRWYGTHILLPDGRFVVAGGRRAFNYEFLAPEGKPSPGRIDLPFLKDTTDLYENNLYPFIHVTPDGNLFILANTKSILLDVRTNTIVRTYPDIPGGARNYPGSACSTILMMDLQATQNRLDYPDMEVLVCGGGDPIAFGKAEKENIFLPALDTCGRIKVMDPNPQWAMEKMPTPRVMSDMLNLPNGEIILINGAQKGASGWGYADEPNFSPVIYSPNKPAGQRFKTLAPTLIARMYHSTSAILPDGKIIVAGSNTNPSYMFNNAKFPTELRVEKFSPPYLDPNLAKLRPVLNNVPKPIKYQMWFDIQFQHNGPGPIQLQDLMASLYKPPFTTHGYSMNQRLLSLPVAELAPGNPGTYTLRVQAPATTALAPPGYFLFFLNYQGVPSVASWTQLLN